MITWLITLSQTAILVSCLLATKQALDAYSRWQFARNMRELAKVMPTVLEGLEALSQARLDDAWEDFEVFMRQNPLWFFYRNPSASTVEVWTEAEEWALLDEYETVEPRFYGEKHEVPKDARFIGAKIGNLDEFRSIQETVTMLARWRKSNEDKE